MDVRDVPAVPLDAWLALLEREYLRDFLPAGGAGVKFAVAGSEILDRIPGAAAGLAERHHLLPVTVSAGTTRLHMLQDLFFAVARSLPWDALLQRYLEGLFSRNGYAWPRPGQAMTMGELAASFGVALNLLARSRDQWLSRDLWEDAR